MTKSTQYNEVRNIILVVKFNEPSLDVGFKYQPVTIEAHCEALTTEKAVRNVINRVLIGTITDTPITLKQIYNNMNKTTVGGILADVLKGALLDALDVDPSI